MKPTTAAIKARLFVAMLSALVAVGCSSESEPDLDAAMPVSVVLSDVASDHDCMKYYPGVAVNFSSAEVDETLLGEIGGVCTLSNTVLSTAADTQRSSIMKSQCSLADGAAAAIADGDRRVALTKLHGYFENGQYSPEDFDALKLALSLCGYEPVLDIAVKEFMASVDLIVESIGSVDHNESRCPAILWSISNEQYGKSFNLEGLGNCADVKLDREEIFNAENNPRGLQRSDYLNALLGYDGVLPVDINEPDGGFVIASSEKPRQITHPSNPAKSLALAKPSMPEQVKTHIRWSSGDTSVDTTYLQASEALGVQYHSDTLMGMSPDERALIALQRSYGEPVISDIRQVGLGIQPGVHATVKTSSGDQFVMTMTANESMNELELIEWLEQSRFELLVEFVRGVDDDGHLTLESAVFTDGDQTIKAKLEDCRCETQGALGSLDRMESTLASEREQLRKTFISRARNTMQFKDWVVSSELGPRAISYVTSSYQKSELDNDAMFVLHDSSNESTLYVAMDLSCREESLLFDIDGASSLLNARCRSLATGGVAYTVLDGLNELLPAVQAGSRMHIGFLAPEAEAPHENFEFSLQGAASAIDGLLDDEADIDDATIRYFENSVLSAETERGLFDMLQQRPVYCRQGTNSPTCVMPEETVKLAAAKPVAPVVRRKVRVAQPEDRVLGFTKVLAEQIGASKKAACVGVAKSMLEVARSGKPSGSREKQIDALISSAPNDCF